MGYAPYIDSAELSDRGRWYRVKLKGFETKEQAQKVVDGLQAKVKGLQCMISAEPAVDSYSGAQRIHGHQLFDEGQKGLD